MCKGTNVSWSCFNYRTYFPESNVGNMEQRSCWHLLDGPIPAMVLGVCMQHAVEPGEVCQPDQMALVSLTGFLSSPSRLLAWTLTFLPCVSLRTVLPLPAERLPTSIGHIPRPMHAGQACLRPGRQRPGLAAEARTCAGRRVAQGLYGVTKPCRTTERSARRIQAEHIRYTTSEDEERACQQQLLHSV